MQPTGNNWYAIGPLRIKYCSLTCGFQLGIIWGHGEFQKFLQSVHTVNAVPVFQFLVIFIVQR